MNDFLVSLVVPCYNEAENIAPLLSRVEQALKSYSYEVILVNDGSHDGTQLEIETAILGNHPVKFISLSKNFGHQAALKAGIDHAAGDCIITIDADLQKPPEAIPEMIALWQRGNDIVTAVCKNEGQSSLFKRFTSIGYYRVLSWLADHEVLPNGADFRLFDKKVADIIRNIQTQNLYYKRDFFLGGLQTDSYILQGGKKKIWRNKVWDMENGQPCQQWDHLLQRETITICTCGWVIFCVSGFHLWSLCDNHSVSWNDSARVGLSDSEYCFSIRNTANCPRCNWRIYR